MERLEHEAIIRAIEMTGENLSQTAKILGIGRSTLYRKMERYGIKVFHNDTEKPAKDDPASEMIQLATL